MTPRSPSCAPPAADAMGAAALMAPAGLLPAGALTHALAACFARLQKAWLGAAGARRRIAAMIAGEAVARGLAARDVLAELGPGSGAPFGGRGAG